MFNDPPHARVREIIASALTPGAIADVEPSLDRLVDDLLDRIEGKGQVDVLEDFSRNPARPAGDPQALPYLLDETDQRQDGLVIFLEAFLSSNACATRGSRLSASVDWKVPMCIEQLRR